ncbi:MAG: hypothetical protein ACK4HV_02910 [Parachlamydiaceae bacterium]
MENLLIGFVFQPAINSYAITLAATGEMRIVDAEDIECFLIEQGFISSSASMGGSYVPAEILDELGFNAEVSLCA